ncbi:hypothetical protein ABW20_dc0101744 [Dactylellina cionopaga]|nr:hypothetical protein ABW20_dc0101744 [Dactylellina cionopaga]
MDLSASAHQEKDCSDSDGFKDLWISCRLVNKRWKDVIENSPMLLRRTWRTVVVDPKFDSKPKLKIESEKERMLPRMIPAPIALRYRENKQSNPRLALCYPFISWCASRLAKLESHGGAVDYLKLPALRKAENFPDVYFTQPPVTDLRIAFKHNNKLEGSQGLDRKFSDAESPVTLRLVRCCSHASDDEVYVNGILIQNPNGITTKDVMHGFESFAKLMMDPKETWNRGKGPWVLNWLSFGPVILYPEPRDDGVIGYSEQWALVRVGNSTSYELVDVSETIKTKENGGQETGR